MLGTAARRGDATECRTPPCAILPPSFSWGVPMSLRFCRLAALLFLPLTIGPAFAGSFAGTSAGASSGGTSGTTGSSSGDDKVIVEARRDAAAFVASDGAIRGVRLEAALRHLRTLPDTPAEVSDLALAKAILAR